MSGSSERKVELVEVPVEELSPGWDDSHDEHSDDSDDSDDISTPPADLFTVVSHTHGMHPWARVLQLAGHDVQLFTTRRRYTRAFAGLVRCSQWDLGRHDTDGRVLLTDSRTVAQHGDHSTVDPHWHSEVLRVTFGGWSFLWVPAMGAWDGGRGPRVMAGGTLARLGQQGACPSVPVLERFMATERGLEWSAPAHGFIDVLSDLLLQVFAADLPAVVSGSAPQSAPPAYAVGTVVSVPPWPGVDRWRTKPPRPQPVLSLAEAAGEGLGQGPVADEMVLHDFTVRGGKPYLAGTDGWLGTAVGQAGTLDLAARRSVAIAQRIGLPEIQYRTDVAALAAEVVRALDVKGMWVVE